MIKSSTDPEVNNIRFRSSNKMFQNSECVFLEYNDCIQLPWLTLLTIIREDNNLDDVLKTSEIRYLSPQALSIFYANRKNKNILFELMKNTEGANIEELDTILNEMINDNGIYFKKEIETLIVPIIQNLIGTEIVKKIIVHYPIENEFVRQDVYDKFGNKAQVVFGDMKLALQKTPKDTTYFFSDAMNVLLLEELDKINYSAIMLCRDFGYNFVDDEKSKFIIDIDYLSKKYTFKWALFSIF